jgi:hypothetical protein
MRITCLDGYSYDLHLYGNLSKGSKNNKSSFHLKAREIIKSVYPTLQILEELTVYIRKNEIAYLDFYLPLTKTCIEVHGEQHYQFTPFYHANKLAFLKSKKRDNDKKEWCLLNNIRYIEFPYNQTENWENIITNENS